MKPPYTLSLRNLLYEKLRLREVLREKLGLESARKALSDYHARKLPIQCGATIHSVVGCTFRCVYCYLPDMGVSFENAQPYGLTGLEMALALLGNKYFLPGLLGTYLAIGSLGEPLHPLGLKRTLEYVEALASTLHNPIQLSTKALVPLEAAERLARISGAPINPMVTIVTLNHHRSLEPGAPSPQLRLESIKRLRRAGLKPTLFLRPIIPGLESEIPEILKLAKRQGAVSVVLGSLRVTPAIIGRLRRAGLPVGEILKRLGKPLREGRQVSIPSRDLKEAALEEARRIGLTPLFSACCANTLNMYLARGLRIPCAGLDFAGTLFCTKCPVDCASIKPLIDLDEAKWALEKYVGLTSFRLRDDGLTLVVESSNPRKARRRLKARRPYVKMIETAYRRRIRVEE